MSNPHLDRQHEHEHTHLGLGLTHSHIHAHSGYHDPGNVPFDSEEHNRTRHVHSDAHGDVIRDRTPKGNGVQNDVVDAALYLGNAMEQMTRDIRNLTAIMGPGLKGICPFCEEATASPREAVMHILSTHTAELSEVPA